MSSPVHIIDGKIKAIEQDRCRACQMRDEELVSRVLSGDKTAFNELLEPHVTFMRYRVRSILKNDADVQDAVQEAMVCAFTKLHQLRDARFFRAWLMRIAINCARMKLRGRSSWLAMDSIDEIFSDRPGKPLKLQIIDLRRSPSVYFERREIQENLQKALMRLPLSYRQVFVLREIRQLNAKETAAILHITIPLVKTHLYRARERLRNMLMPLYRTRSSRHHSNSTQELVIGRVA